MSWEFPDEQRARARGRVHLPRWLLGFGLLTVLAFSGCGHRGLGRDAGAHDRPQAAVVGSEAYAADAGTAEQRDKLNRLFGAAEALRSETGSGWRVRQDDVTGLAGELTGGPWRAPRGTDPVVAVETFLQRHGAAFGLDDPRSQLTLPTRLEVDDLGGATMRSQQVVRGVAVDGSSMLVVVDDAATAPTISFVSGRIFSGLAVSTTPSIDAVRAAAVITEIAGAAPLSPPALVVYTRSSTPVLAWRAPANVVPREPLRTTGQPGGTADVFVDGSTALLLEIRERSSDFGLVVSAGSVRADAATPGVNLPPRGQPTTVSGTIVGDRPVQVSAEGSADGSVVLIDSSLPGANRDTGRGVISVHDGSKAQSYDDLPGPVFTVPNPGAVDRDALSVAFGAREVLDYYRTEHGRASFDGKNAPVVATVQAPPKVFPCNAKFLRTEQRLAFSQPCPQTIGPAISLADLAVIAHELTHGVTAAGAQLGGTAQSTAVNEGTSDYFGVVIQDRFLREPYSTLGVMRCTGVVVVAAGHDCRRWGDGQRGLRNLDTGATLDDAELLLDDAWGLGLNTRSTAGHHNSIIYTNALWKIRSHLAGLDHKSPVVSIRARRFDRVVYRATTRYFNDETDLVAAAEAVERAAGEVPGVTAADRELIHRQMITSRLCERCLRWTPSGTSVATSSHLKTQADLTSGGVVYTDFSSPLSARIFLAPDGPGRAAPITPPGEAILSSAAAGDAAVRLSADRTRSFVVLRHLASGAEERLSSRADLRIAPAISDHGLVVWADEPVAGSGGPQVTLRARSVEKGEVRSLPLAKAVDHVATDGQNVAFVQQDGVVMIWDTTQSDARSVGRLPATLDNKIRRAVVKPPGGIVLSGRRIAVLGPGSSTYRWRLFMFDTSSGARTLVSAKASPFGLALDGDLLVWAEDVGPLGGKVAQLMQPGFYDTDIYALSVATNTRSLIEGGPGQQGYPSLDGRRLVWQDAAGGSNDIFTTTLPEHL